MDSPLRITVYDKTFTRTAWIEDFVEHHVTPRHLALGTADVVVATDSRWVPALTDDGARVVIELERDGETEQVMSGPVRNWTVTGGRLGVTTFSVEDDTRVLWNLLGYPSPANPADTQPAKEDSRTGPAETVVKAFLAANLPRWGRPYTIAPSLGRGSTITAGVRMMPLAEKLLDQLEGSGVGLSVRQVGAGLLVDCYATQLFPLVLSEDAGTVDTWSLTRSGHTATRAIVGGPNEGTSREFKLVVDAAREALYRDPIEIMVDATDQEIAAKIIAKGTDALAAAGPKYGCAITLSETSVFRYGGSSGLHVGDQVEVEFGMGLPDLDDVVREAPLSFTRDDGYQAQFSIGEDATDPDQANAELLAQLVQAVHELRTR